MNEIIISFDNFILALTIIFNITIICLEIVYTKAGSKSGWYPLKESIIRIVVPLLISVLWICFTFFSLWSFLIILSWAISTLIFLILHYTEYYYGAIAGLDCLGRYTLYYHRFLKRPEVITDTKLYYASEYQSGMTDLFEMIDAQIQSDKKISDEKAKDLQKKITEFKKTYKDAKIRYFFYLDTREITFGYKCLIVVTERQDLTKLKKLEGAMLPGGKAKFFDREHKIIILFEGQGTEPSSEFLQKLEEDHYPLVEVYNNAGDVRLLHITKKKLEGAHRREKEIEDNFNDEIAREYLKERMLGRDTRKDTQKIMNQFYKYIFILGLIISTPMTIFIILAILGVI